jgi:hypothetical protein
MPFNVVQRALVPQICPRKAIGQQRRKPLSEVRDRILQRDVDRVDHQQFAWQG